VGKHGAVCSYSNVEDFRKRDAKSANFSTGVRQITQGPDAHAKT